MSGLTCCTESECRKDNKHGFKVCYNPIAYLDTFEKKCPVRKELEKYKEKPKCLIPESLLKV